MYNEIPKSIAKNRLNETEPPAAPPTSDALPNALSSMSSVLQNLERTVKILEERLHPFIDEGIYSPPERMESATSSNIPLIARLEIHQNEVAFASARIQALLQALGA